MAQKLKESILSKVEPKDTNVVWYQPTEGGIKEKIYNGGWKDINKSDIKIGDKLLHPEGKENEVVEIPFEEECDQYKITLDDGSEVLCSLAHNWKVSYRKDENGNKIWDIVTTKFMLDNPHFEFEIPKI